MVPVQLPGHAMGFAAARNTTPTGAGLRFCNSSAEVQLFDDPGGHTFAALSALLSEAASMFPDPVFHIGGDETVVSTATGPCTLHGFGKLLRKLQRVLTGLGKVPMGWNDLLTRTSSALPGTIIDAWSPPSYHFDAWNATSLGFQTVDSSAADFYLMSAFGQNASVTWRDIAVSSTGQRLAGKLRSLLLGGSASVWTGDYAAVGCLFPFRVDRPPRLFYGERCPGTDLITLGPNGTDACNAPCHLGPCQCGNTSEYRSFAY